MVIESATLINYALMAVAGGSATLAFKIIFQWLKDRKNGNGKSGVTIDIFGTVVAMNVLIQDIKKTMEHVEEKLSSLDKNFAIHIQVSKELEKKVDEVRDACLRKKPKRKRKKE